MKQHKYKTVLVKAGVSLHTCLEEVKADLKKVGDNSEYKVVSFLEGKKNCNSVLLLKKVVIKEKINVK